MLIESIQKYIDNPSPVRLDIILELAGKKTVKKNADMAKLLIEDYKADQKIEPLLQWLSPEVAAQTKKEKAENIVLGPMNQDHFESMVIKSYGDPKDPNSAGNRLLDGKLDHFHISSYYDPQVLLDKFAIMASKASVALEIYPQNMGSQQGEPTWECVLAGRRKLKRKIEHSA